MATSSENSAPDKAWIEFCERHASAAAQDFSKSCHNYINMCLPENARHLVNHKDLMKKFLEFFKEEFDRDFSRRQLGGTKCTNGVASLASNEDSFDIEDGSPKMSHKPFFRRLSFKMLRKSKDLFHKHSDEDSITHNKTKLAKIVVECRKEGIVNYSTPECLDQPSGPPKWERCRLQLVKATGGYMLEFYSPPKNPKPRSGVFCALITEARETTALEMPDHENTFVLKASNNMEFVIEAHDTDDMRSWLATIKYCMRLGPGASEAGGITDYQSNNAPDLPPRHAAGASSRLSSSSNFDICPSGDTHNTESDIGQTLKKELWFHGMLPRSEATQQVLHDGAGGHGRFLVRQSETRTGEFVLTFNFQGRAKHLRMTINEHGQCRLQHYWFASIYEMLENFRTHPIPLESGGNSDVTLTDYILNPNARQQLQHSGTRSAVPSPNNTLVAGQGTSANGSSDAAGATRRAPLPVPEVRQVVAHNGSIRSQDALAEQHIETPNRAVENQYSFV
ncbi:unnamed protein product [Ceutorhynchus assimilis]|uniref:SH2B adapter protein 1 n=1 Tax=Ceutorhynchus assimilis TaxID=467358 RepID=A0A9N9QHK1_9CUCU|nr:unnamed protein product [Ceutorhynchus assimilis]